MVKIQGQRVLVWGWPLNRLSFLIFPLAKICIGPAPLTDVGIRHTWRDVGPCRVRLASLMDWAGFQLFLTDEERFANQQLWKIYAAGVPGEIVGR